MRETAIITTPVADNFVADNPDTGPGMIVARV
jgi:hypothetical protein